MADGQLVFDGPTSDAIGLYRRMLAVQPTAETPIVGRPRDELRINGRPADDTIECQSNDALFVELEVNQPPDATLAGVELNLVIETPDGRMAVHLRNDLDSTVLSIGPGRNALTVDIEDLALVPGNYTLWLRVVSLQAAEPVIWDTERLPLMVAGDQRLGSIVQPRHRFGQRAKSA